jgi:hypothetical protein
MLAFPHLPLARAASQREVEHVATDGAERECHGALTGFDPQDPAVHQNRLLLDKVHRIIANVNADLNSDMQCVRAYSNNNSGKSLQATLALQSTALRAAVKAPDAPPELPPVGHEPRRHVRPIAERLAP